VVLGLGRMPPAVVAELTTCDTFNGSDSERLRPQGGYAPQPVL